LIVFGALACTSEDAALITESAIIKEDTSASDRLIIYSGRGEGLVGPIINQFRDATGIKVEVKYDKTTPLATMLLEEGNNTRADVFFAQDPGGLGAVENMLAPLPTDILNSVPEWARSSEGKWVGLSGRARAIVYNNEKLTEADLPDDIWDLVDAKWKGRIGWAPTNASFQTMVTAMRSIWGEEKTKQWLVGIQANDPKVYPKNTPQVAAAAAGEIDVGLVNHYYLFRFLAEEGDSFSARNYHPRSGGPGAVVMVAGAGVLSSAENVDNAEKFLKFLLSPVAQQYFAGQTYEYPLVEGVKTSRLLVPLSEITKPDVTVAGLEDLQGTVTLLQKTGILP
jgi:iron(III) transport system substrate-binding protein